MRLSNEMIVNHGILFEHAKEIQNEHKTHPVKPNQHLNPPSYQNH